MFVFTMKFNKKMAVAIVLAVAVLLAVIVLAVGFMSDKDSGGNKLADISHIKSNEDRLAYLQSLGWECEETAVEEQDIVIPREFSAVFAEYNELQKGQGFDLSDYCGVDVKLYRYNVLNYPEGEKDVVAQLLIYNNQIIGGDIHSLEESGFMHGLK